MALTRGGSSIARRAWAGMGVFLLAGLAQAEMKLNLQEPAVVQAMRAGAILISFVYAHKEPELTRLLRDRRITCFAMELVPRITRAQAWTRCRARRALAGYYAALLGATNLARWCR